MDLREYRLNLMGRIFQSWPKSEIYPDIPLRYCPSIKRIGPLLGDVSFYEARRNHLDVISLDDLPIEDLHEVAAFLESRKRVSP